MANAIYPKFKEQALQGGVNLSSADVKVLSTSRSGNGAYNFVWYDNTEQVYSVARENDNFIGRSANGVAT